MILTYKACMAGPYHIENEIPCQDACHIAKSSDGIVVAAVADGLGSELHSDIGATIASEVSVAHCAEKIVADMKKEEVLALMKESYEIAYEAVVAVARSKAEPEEEYPEDEYDCTLCLAIFDGSNLYYGQSGDSGMIALLNDGNYVKVTEQQRDGWGRVYPLCFGEDEWVFGMVEDVEAVMLMTDGVWEELCQGEEAAEVNVDLAKQFLDLKDVKETDLPELEEKVREYLENYPVELINDDKTVVVLYCEAENTVEDVVESRSITKKRISTIYDEIREKLTKIICQLMDHEPETICKEDER